MEFSGLELCVIALAVNGVVEIWHHGSIFAGARAWMETRPLGDFVGELTECPFCLSVWVAGAVVGGWAAARCLLPAVEPGVIAVITTAAAARTANLINDAAKRWLRLNDTESEGDEPVDHL